MGVISPTEEVLVSVEDGVATVTMNRPNELNALTDEMLSGLGEIFYSISQDDDVKAVILTGAGRAFGAGGASKVLAMPVMDRVRRDKDAKITRKWWSVPLAAQLLNIYNCTKPTIAAINGIVVGVTVSIASGCDIRIASDKARFGLAFAGASVVPDGGASYLLPRLIRIDRALELFYSNRIIDANEALQIGMVTKVVPHEELMQASRELAIKIAKGPTIALELGRRGLRLGLDNTLENQMFYETYAQSVAEITDDFKEASQAFRQKRKPIFTGT
ncbi:MAG: enoyl-CoA hydratase-related protein [bacterium]